MKRHQKYTKESLEVLCKESYSLNEVLRKTGRCESGYNSQYLKSKIEEFGIDTSHFTGRAWSKGKTHAEDRRIKNKMKYSINEIFVKNSKVHRKVIKKYCKLYNLIPYKCVNCGCTGNWQGGIISLELDHIDGDKKNNELSNLRYLCPNCHALTDTYCGRNIKNQK